MPSDTIISLTLLGREHHRLHAQASQLRTHTLSLKQLHALRHDWFDHLGFLRHAPPLYAALDRLIEQQEEERIASDEAYGEVLYHLSLYRQRSWQTLERKYSSVRHFLDTHYRLRLVYRQLFTRVFESHGTLSLAQQAKLLHQLHPPTCSAVADDRHADPPRYFSTLPCHRRQ